MVEELGDVGRFLVLSVEKRSVVFRRIGAFTVGYKSHLIICAGAATFRPAHGGITKL